MFLVTEYGTHEKETPEAMSLVYNEINDRGHRNV
jgi:hypothetical protein